MQDAKDRAKDEKLRQLQRAGAEAVVAAETERLGICIKPVFDKEKIFLDCTLDDSTVIHLRTDYRKFTAGSVGIFRFLERMDGISKQK